MMTIRARRRLRRAARRDWMTYATIALCLGLMVMLALLVRHA